MRTYVFPGQGSQGKGMGGVDLFDEFEDLTRTADAILGYSIRTLCLDDPDRKLDRTRYTQPALYVVNALSYYRKLRETGVVPDFVAGHSLGEFNALLAAGAYDFETGLRLVQKRGELMSQATNGAMAAVLNASEREVRAVLEEGGLAAVDLANFNTPSQIVISGRAEDIETARPLFQTGKHLFVSLKTSGAFHSRYMEPARAEFARFLAGTSVSELQIPVISNVTARPYENHRVKELLTRQIVSSVRWSETIEYLLGYEEMDIEEIGHGSVLAKLTKKIRREASDIGMRQANPVEKSPERPVKKPVESADVKVRKWNEAYSVGTCVRSTTGDYGNLETATQAIVLFGHRPAVYVHGYRGYFDLDELEPVR